MAKFATYLENKNKVKHKGDCVVPDKNSYGKDKSQGNGRGIDHTL